MHHLWIPNVFVYNLVSFKALECLEKLAGLWFVEGKKLFYNQVSKIRQGFEEPFSFMKCSISLGRLLLYVTGLCGTRLNPFSLANFRNFASLRGISRYLSSGRSDSM